MRLDAFMLYGMKLSFNHPTYFYTPIKCLCFNPHTFVLHETYFLFLSLEFEKCLEPILGFMLKADSNVHDSNIHDI
jgi:hypothetical protein